MKRHLIAIRVRGPVRDAQEHPIWGGPHSLRYRQVFPIDDKLSISRIVTRQVRINTGEVGRCRAFAIVALNRIEDPADRSLYPGYVVRLGAARQQFGSRKQRQAEAIWPHGQHPFAAKPAARCEFALESENMRPVRLENGF